MDTNLFGWLLIAFALIGVVAASLSYVGVGQLYRSLGRGGSFGLDLPEGSASGKPAAAPRRDPRAELAIAREEVRQMLNAKSDRRVARGEQPLDVEAELEALLGPPPSTADAPEVAAPAAAVDRDPALREEIRQLVVANNERRVRRGQQPLDVDAEVERRLRDLGGAL